MIITLDKYGRILIPKKIRKLLGIGPESQLVIKEQGDKIIIQPLKTENSWVKKEDLLIYTGNWENKEIDLLNEMRQDRDHQLLGM